MSAEYQWVGESDPRATFTREELAGLFIEAYNTAKEIDGPPASRSDIARTAFIYLLGRTEVTAQFASIVPGFEHLTSGQVSA
jgi:hypothetical protein